MPQQNLNEWTGDELATGINDAKRYIRMFTAQGNAERLAESNEILKALRRELNDRRRFA
jgi:hypothetical protein